MVLSVEVVSYQLCSCSDADYTDISSRQVKHKYSFRNKMDHACLFWHEIKCCQLFSKIVLAQKKAIPYIFQLVSRPSNSFSVSSQWVLSTELKAKKKPKTTNISSGQYFYINQILEQLLITFNVLPLFVPVLQANELSFLSEKNCSCWRMCTTKN